MRSRLRLAALAAVLSAAAWLLPSVPASGDEPSPAPSESPSPSPSESPSPSPSESPSPSPSESPSASPSPSPAPTGPSELTIGVRPPVAVWGTRFRIAGALVCLGQPVAGAPVHIQRRPAGTWTFETVASRTTDTAGSYAFEHTPASSGDYRAIVPGGTGPCGVSTSATARADVRPGVATNVERARLPRGWSAVLNGAVAPAHAGRKVYLQIYDARARAWRNSAVAALDRSSRYRIAYRRTSPGMLLFRVVYPTQDADHAWNVGRNTRVDWT